MPGSLNFQDEEDEDEYIRTAPGASKSPSPDQQPFPSQRSSFDESDNLSIGSTSVVSALSTISTRKKKKRFLAKLRGRKKQTEANDGESVTSSASRFSWWGGSQGSTLTKRRKFRLWKRKKRKANDQLVAEFFDGKGGSTLNDTDSPSVASGWTLSSSNGLMGMILRRRANRGEDILEREKSNFFGHGIVGSAVDQGIDDEEITLASGFENLSVASSADDASVGSRSSLASSSQNAWQIPRRKRPKTFLDRMLKQRRRKKKDTAIRLALKGDERSESEGTFEDLQQPREKSIKKERSVKSLGDTPSSTSCGKIVSRWDSNDSIVSDASAPKKPKRRTEEASKPKSSQSMRNLTATSNEFEDDESDDDSVLSLLSGLLMAWSEDQIETYGKLPFGNPRKDVEVKSILKSAGSASSRPKNSVVFAAIEMREYERIVGDNPSCSRGPPISIGWSYVLAFQGDVDEYETSVKAHKRSKKEFYCTAEKRIQILSKEWGVTREEMNRARRECTYIQYCRAKTSFSTSRAAAKEAAFLRKANDRMKLLDIKLEKAPTGENSTSALADLPVTLKNGLSMPSKKATTSSPVAPLVTADSIATGTLSSVVRPAATTPKRSFAANPKPERAVSPPTTQSEGGFDVEPEPKARTSSPNEEVQCDQNKASLTPVSKEAKDDSSEGVPAAEDSSVSTSQTEMTKLSSDPPLSSEFLEI